MPDITSSEMYLLWKITELEIGKIKKKRASLEGRFQREELSKDKFVSGMAKISEKIQTLRNLRDKLNMLRNKTAS